MQPQTLHISSLQFDLAWEQPQQNYRLICAQWERFQPQTDILLLPEMFATGFSMNVEALAESMQGESVQFLREFSLTYPVLVTGSLIIRENGQVFNRFLGFYKGEQLFQYDKRHLFRMANEHEFYTAGSEKCVFEFKGWKICPLVCYDLRFPVWSRNRNLEYDVLLYVANWPQRRHSHWTQLLPARAIENQAFVAGVNRVGLDGNQIPYQGGTLILDYLGNPLAKAPDQESCIISAELDYAALAEYRAKFPAYLDADGFGLS